MVKEILVHVGLHKCGSTWLQKNLFVSDKYGFVAPWGSMSHAAVTNFVEVDPLCFDSKEVRKEFYQSLKMYDAEFKVAVVSHEALSSRPHHGKYYAPYAAERIKSVFPEAKILFIFREQPSIIYSLYVEHIRNGGKHTFEEFIGTDREKPGWSPLCKLSFFEFDRLLDMYNDIFGSVNVLALPLELLRINPEKFVGDIFSHVNLPSASLETRKIINVGMGVATTEIFRLSNNFIRKDALGRSIPISFKVRDRISRRIEKLTPNSLQVLLKRKRLDVLDKRIGGFFGRSNKRLNSILKLDLETLGYKME